ncbi:hypothetical protein JCM10212_000523 [Sporobolomyces blumeae]
MLASVRFAVIVAVLANVVVGQTINIPTSVQVCEPQQLAIKGGSPPYDVAVLPGGATGGATLARFDKIDAPGIVTWTPDVAAGQNITFAVRDSTGAEGFSPAIPVVEGTSTDCLESAVDANSASQAPESTSSASFDSLSLSSLLASLTAFVPPIPTTPTTPLVDFVTSSPSRSVPYPSDPVTRLAEIETTSPTQTTRAPAATTEASTSTASSQGSAKDSTARTDADGTTSSGSTKSIHHAS